MPSLMVGAALSTDGWCLKATSSLSFSDDGTLITRVRICDRLRTLWPPVPLMAWSASTPVLNLTRMFSRGPVATAARSARLSAAVVGVALGVSVAVPVAVAVCVAAAVAVSIGVAVVVGVVVFDGTVATMGDVMGVVLAAAVTEGGEVVLLVGVREGDEVAVLVAAVVAVAVLGMAVLDAPA